MTGVLAIDAGQTGMKVRVRGASEPDVDLLFPGIRTHEPLLPQLAAVALRVAEQTGAHPDVVAAGRLRAHRPRERRRAAPVARPLDGRA